MEALAVITVMLGVEWMSRHQLCGTSRSWNAPMEERLRRAHRGAHPFGHGLKTNTPQHCLHPQIPKHYIYIFSFGVVGIYSGACGCWGVTISIGVHGIANLRGRTVQLNSQLDGERRISRIRWDEIQQLDRLVVHLQTCVDQSHRHLADNEPEAAQETLALQLSEDHYPPREWVGKIQ